MQLILDEETTMDIENEMSTIDQESLNEKFASDIVDKFSNDLVSNSDKDYTESQENLLSDSKQNNIIIEKETDETKKTETSYNEDNDNNKTKDLQSENFVENLDVKSCNNKEELKEKEIEENKDVNIHEDLKLESCNDLSSENLGDKENTCQTELSTTLDEDFIKPESNLSESSNFTKEDPSDEGIKSFDIIEKSNENKQSDNLETDVINDSQISDMLEKDKEEQNIDSTVIVNSQNSDGEKSLCTVSSYMDCTTEPEKIITNEENITSTIHNEKIEITLKTSTEDDRQCNENSTKDNSEQQEQDKKQVLESESITVEKLNEKIISEKIDDRKQNETKQEKADECDSKKLEEKKKSSLVSKLSNTLDILSDDEDEQHENSQNIDKPVSNDKQCMSLEEDDDIMLIDEDTGTKKDFIGDDLQIDKTLSEQSSKTCNVENSTENISSEIDSVDMKNEAATEKTADSFEENELDDKKNDCNGNVNVKPLLPSSFLKTCKKNLVDMTREDLEEFCILKIVESIVDRSNLGDIKTQLKTMALTVEEYKKKAMMLSKQNRDLQVVLKSVQEEQKKSSVFPITPLKITRSVGMQVLMTDKPSGKRKSLPGINSSNASNCTVLFNNSNRSSNNQKLQKGNTNNQQIPVPRLVLAANNTATKAISTIQTNTINAAVKSQQTNNLLPNGIRNSPPAQKPEKRPRIQSVTVDLTDDEPPSKITSRSSPAPPVRLVPPQNLIAPQRQQFATNMSSPRKVYIPISGPQAQNVRPGQTIMLKSVPPNQGPRQRVPPSNSLAKMQSNTIRMNRVQSNRHPAPLPDAMKQYQPPNWKALPPAPDLKLSKVENGIVISWKIDGYQDDSYEEIASYQLYAYQETNSPPSTALWKKIGDVKALPLPMACTLTQFMAGYKYYFAVRAVDVKSRLGPFSLPGSILLLNKM